MKIKDFAAEIKSGDNKDGGSIVAYASTFDREPDSYGDIVAPGAFTKSLNKWREKGNPIPLLFGHRTDDPEMNIGACYEYAEDEHGLRVEATFDPDNEKAQYCRKLVKEGRLTKLSFAYNILDAGVVRLADGREAYELRELDIFEVSLVPIPANHNAEVVSAKADEVEEPETAPEPAAEPEPDEVHAEPVEEVAEPDTDETPATDEPVEEVDEKAAPVDGAKAGRVISKSNEEKIRDAVAILNDVLALLDETADEPKSAELEHKEDDEAEAKAGGVEVKEAPAQSSPDLDFIALMNSVLTEGE